MYRLLRWLLFRMEPETAHRLGMGILRVLGRNGAARIEIRSRAQPKSVDLSVSIAGLRFPNPLGLAAGLDKNATAVQGLFALGFGAVEVGTVTPRPQPGNPRPRVFRISEHQALINRLGFNNDGAEAVAARLKRLNWRPGLIGVNIGKNKDTPNERAVGDYVTCIQVLGPFADYIVLNVSSPNTPGLRELQHREHLKVLLSECRAALQRISPSRPLFLKIAPDLDEDSLDAILVVGFSCRVDGVIATNTTVQRPFEHRLAREMGGLSGKPLEPLSTELARRIYIKTAGRMPVIGTGGIFTAEDAYRRIRAGASAVQIYTGLIYRGPGVVHSILHRLAELMIRDGFSTLEEARGKE